MNGYHPGAGSPLTFVDTSDTTMDYTIDQSAPFFEEQQIAQTCPAGFGQSSVGASSATNDSHEQAKADDLGRSPQPTIETLGSEQHGLRATHPPTTSVFLLTVICIFACPIFKQ